MMKIKIVTAIASIILCVAVFLSIRLVQATNLAQNVTHQLTAVKKKVSLLEEKLQQAQEDLKKTEETIAKVKAEKEELIQKNNKEVVSEKKEATVKTIESPSVSEAGDNSIENEGEQQVVSQEAGEEGYTESHAIEQPADTNNTAVDNEPNWNEQFRDPNLTGADRAKLGKAKGEYYGNKYGH